ncbi:unnamed protein product [Psylliodes chrysocephalus]|uniref:Uncharacterized protein n=1 Tax=Psylliodes chrysocephalus TaxID=3402493 RepID=A0A9P0CLG8_9CUCU|nr:unnamed protein product [Psylliodes chrysocephala]
MINQIDKPTRFNRSIDAIFSKITASATRFQICTFPLHVSVNEKPEIFHTRDFSDYNLMSFRNTLLNENWRDVYSAKSTNVCFESFFTTFQYHYQKNFTHKKVRNNHKTKSPWVTKQNNELHHMVGELCSIARSTENEVNISTIELNINNENTKDNNMLVNYFNDFFASIEKPNPNYNKIQLHLSQNVHYFYIQPYQKKFMRL